MRGLKLFIILHNFGNGFASRVVTQIFKPVKFIYSEKATKFCEIFTYLLTATTLDKSKVKILQHFVPFSEYMNFSVDAWWGANRVSGFWFGKTGHSLVLLQNYFFLSPVYLFTTVYS